MAGREEGSSVNGNHERSMEEGALANFPNGVAAPFENRGLEKDRYQSSTKEGCGFPSVPFIQKIIAEVLGTYFVIFAGCGSEMVNFSKGMVTFPGICIAWGLVVMVMIYSVGHISGAHFNPAITIASATTGRFPWKQVPAYILSQVMSSILASGTLRLLFDGKHDHFFGTIPTGSDVQSLVLEFIVTFYLAFVISAVATDNRAIGELAGLAVGATILLNGLFIGPISGGSMNPARTLGPAIVMNQYEGIWVYMVGPISGAVAGAWAYNLVRFTDKPLCEITKIGSFLKSQPKNGSSN